MKTPQDHLPPATTARPSTTIQHAHTFHPAAQAAYDRAARRDRKLALALARLPEGDPNREAIEMGRAALANTMNEARATIASGFVVIHLEAVSRGTMRRLRAEHPPRAEDDLDQQVGYNGDSFPDALIQACITETTDLDGHSVPNNWPTWADNMTEAAYADAWETVVKLNGPGTALVPPSRAS